MYGVGGVPADEHLCADEASLCLCQMFCRYEMRVCVDHALTQTKHVLANICKVWMVAVAMEFKFSDLSNKFGNRSLWGNKITQKTCYLRHFAKTIKISFQNTITILFWYLWSRYWPKKSIKLQACTTNMVEAQRVSVWKKKRVLAHFERPRAMPSQWNASNAVATKEKSAPPKQSTPSSKGHCTSPKFEGKERKIVSNKNFHSSYI